MFRDIANQSRSFEELSKACPSIRFRVAAEILELPADDPSLIDLQGQILDDKAVKEVISWQAPDGWLAWNFHGYNSTESGIRLLCEKGLDRRNKVLERALAAIEEGGERIYRGLGNAGRYAEQLGFAGAETIRAYIFAHAGIENNQFVQGQIQCTLERFCAVMAIENLGELCERYRGKLVYRSGRIWPGIYDLRLLAFTYSWRTPQNRAMLVDSIQNLVRLSPFPAILIRYKSQLIAPAAFAMEQFDPDMSQIDDPHWMMWFHRMEMLARLGVIDKVSELHRQIDTLIEMISQNGGQFKKPLTHEYFRHWGAYTGLMLEKDWKVPGRRIADLTFRSLLIIHSANQIVG